MSSGEIQNASGLPLREQLTVENLRIALEEIALEDELERCGRDDDTVVEVLIKNIEARPNLTKIYFHVIKAHWPHLLDRIKTLSAFI